MKPDYETLTSQTLFLPKNRVRIKRSMLARLQSTLTLYYRHYRTRQQLQSLSAEQLSDIGITRGQADQEAKKFFWEN